MRYRTLRRSWVRVAAHRWRQVGQSTTEYALILAMLVLPIAATFNRIRTVLKALLAALNTYLYGPGM